MFVKNFISDPTRKNMMMLMGESKLSKRIEELYNGKHDTESLRHLALKLHGEGYAPALITQEFKGRFGRGVPLTIFSKEPISRKSLKTKISAEKTVQSKINQKITAKANEMVTRYLKTGEMVEERLGPIARFRGYEDTGKFVVEMVYPFFDLHYNHVDKVEVESRSLRLGMQRLMEVLAPEAKRRLFLREASEFIQATALMGLFAPHPVPPDVLQGYIKVLWETFYEDTSAALKDPAFWTKKFIRKAARAL